MALTRVRYKGLSDVRLVKAADLKPRGIKIDGELKWSRENGWSVVVDGMTEEMETWLKEEGTFTIEEIDQQTGKTVKNIVTASRADDTGNTVVDKTTGQKSVKGSGT